MVAKPVEGLCPAVRPSRLGKKMVMLRLDIKPAASKLGHLV